MCVCVCVCRNSRAGERTVGGIASRQNCSRVCCLFAWCNLPGVWMPTLFGDGCCVPTCGRRSTSKVGGELPCTYAVDFVRLTPVRWAARTSLCVGTLGNCPFDAPYLFHVAEDHIRRRCGTRWRSEEFLQPPRSTSAASVHFRQSRAPTMAPHSAVPPITQLAAHRRSRFCVFVPVGCVFLSRFSVSSVSAPFLARCRPLRVSTRICVTAIQVTVRGVKKRNPRAYTQGTTNRQHAGQPTKGRVGLCQHHRECGAQAGCHDTEHRHQETVDADGEAGPVFGTVSYRMPQRRVETPSP